MRRSLAVFSLAILAGCASVSPGSDFPSAVASRPVFDAVSIGGLVFRDERLASRSSSSGLAVTGGGGWATASGRANHYETFESRELQKVLRLSIEDYRVAKKVVPEGRIRVEGIIAEAKPKTGIGRMFWNVLNTVGLIGFYGSPYFGSTKATVQLRVYLDDELLETYFGEGRGNWYGNIYAVRPIRDQAIKVAMGMAVRDAVAQVATNPPELMHDGLALSERREPTRADRPRGPVPAAAAPPGLGRHVQASILNMCSKKWANDSDQIRQCYREHTEAYQQ